MVSITLHNDSAKNDLYPLASVRPVIDLRIGILTLREKWEKAGYTPQLATKGFLPAFLIPEQETIAQLKQNNFQILPAGARQIQYPWDIARWNAEMIQLDFPIVTRGKTSQQVSPSNTCMGTENIFIEPGATVEHCLLNASTGPIYIGSYAEIMEGSMIRGPFAICENSVVKMGTKIYGGTTIGKHCVVGGEIKNVVVGDFSNKAHDGYLGDSVIGEWCNIGAGTSNSNIKNTAGPIKVWHQATREFVNAGLKCGLILGDYSRSAINTSFNTGTVVGICCNVFGLGLTPKYIPDFSWGFGETVYTFEKAIKDIDNWKKLKNQSSTKDEIQQLNHIFELSKLRNV
jgi:UDP-N-acetylglucosamine diphosphorylase/glucosamine-1-phosphate N-acetyltransferase